jgi:oxygen-independent coproporphyrinogen-3 oxidase
MTQYEEVAREDLPFEYMLNALRLKEGFSFADYMSRTGLSMTSIQQGLSNAEAKQLIVRDLNRVWPTSRGFDFLSDLQALFLADR